ncbi:hypothetical protein BRC91_01775 [Halobacteriales archaeon QS_4_62_28]|nr:MAG: hypothetical protein BRC91_01775 [Halobacteriales archaeon QS_4_62_28]
MAAQFVTNAASQIAGSINEKFRIGNIFFPVNRRGNVAPGSILIPIFEQERRFRSLYGVSPEATEHRYLQEPLLLVIDFDSFLINCAPRMRRSRGLALVFGENLFSVPDDLITVIDT